MNEAAQFLQYKKKLQGVCDENDLVFRLRVDTYPITLTIKATSGLDGQMSMLEGVEDKGYISPDASLVFFLRDGKITYKTAATFTISEVLFNKIKNLFKNLYSYWLQYFFRDIVVNAKVPLSILPVINDADTLPDGAEPLESYEDPEE